MSLDRDMQGSEKRKVRRGTFSCWECKRRKIRCVFEPRSNSTSCTGCIRRKTTCVSQMYPEETFSSCRDSHGDSAPLRNWEKSSATYVSGSSGRPASSRVMPLHKSSESRTLDFETQNGPRGNYEKLSQFLFESLPSRADIETISRASIHNSVLTHELMTTPYTILEQDGLKPAETLLEIPGPHTHPVLIARYILQLTMFLQQFHPDLLRNLDNLSESPRAMTERLIDLVSRLVTTDDQLLGSIEGLECVMLESVYHAKLGNLRRSWMASRRAMAIAQLMGLNRSDNRAQYKVLDRGTNYYAETMWLRIIFMDQYLCLMLGLSQGSLDRSIASEKLLANDTPLGRLERIHCVVASKILERNESPPRPQDLELTQTLDIELQQAARNLPVKWWLPPDLVSPTTDPRTRFWDMLRLFAQFHHYNLLNQLHLPYMLRSSSSERKYEYSLITCVNASREVLSRFIALNRVSKISYSCRKVDFLALMAAMTLLIAYLAGTQRANGQSLLAHQYLSDRAMIEQTQETMEVISRIHSDALSAQSAELLRRLLTLKLEPDNLSRDGGRVMVHEIGTDAAVIDQEDDTVVTVQIPYFGNVKIAREGLCKEALRAPPQQSSISNDTGTVDLVYESHEVLPTETIVKENQVSCSAQFQAILADPCGQGDAFPELVALGEDWAFQGVDMAFFESLMRSDTDWTLDIDPNVNSTE